MVIRETKRDRIFNFFNGLILTVVFLLCLYPLWFIIIASISNPDLINAGKVWLIPQDVLAGRLQGPVRRRQRGARVHRTPSSIRRAAPA